MTKRKIIKIGKGLKIDMYKSMFCLFL